jgi:ferredoxin
MIAMLNSILVNDMRTRHVEPILFIHGTRNRGEHCFAAHVRHKAAHQDNLTVLVAYSKPEPNEATEKAHDTAGRIDATLLQRLLPSPDIDVSLCGPPGFMQEQYDALRALGVPHVQIRFEAFGPASIRRTIAPVSELSNFSTAPRINFVRSGLSTRWQPHFASLLDCADAVGLSPLYSCSSGVCGTCATRLLAGEVSYVQPPVADRAHDEVLLCCVRQAVEDDELKAIAVDL